ncbi:MAG TPA: UvrD-helicase domain-containing protein [Nitrospirota bacterium]
MNLNDTFIFDGLNESQKRAVTTTEGPLLIAAGPGTGKTRTIVRRIAHLIHQGVRPENILAVTFTNRAAREMRERTRSMLGDNSRRICIGTFHLLGLKIIRDSRGDDFLLYNREEQIGLLKPLAGGSIRKAGQAAERISRIKNFQDEADGEIRPIYEAYQAALKQKSAFDFDDLILAPINILQDTPANPFKGRFTHIIVDEYQDINPAQYRLMKLLTKGANVCAVGDSDQAIYAFRGADLGNFLNFEKDFPGAAQITLSENYRSSAPIIHAASALIRRNQKRIDKRIDPTRGAGASLSLLSVPDERSEGDMVVQEIEARMGGTSHHQMRQTGPARDFSGRSWRFADFAVLYRTNAQARALEEAFSESGIPYQMVGRSGGLQAQEIEQTLAYLRSFLHEDGAAQVEAADDQESKLMTPADFFDPRADAVTLMTLHMAKGLEFPFVFIAGCEDGLLPCTIMKDDVDIEEERRLFFVGMTRAQDELVLIHSRSRFLYGQRLAPAPSPFLAEIPNELVESVVIPDRVKRQKEPDRQMELL